ncbi:MAG: FAD-dependent oxidoreductase, partial [Mongoliibacter sp.]
MVTSFKTYDIAVIGLGALGSSALWHLSKSGKRIVGIDQFSPPHEMGSSHGETRITRLAVGEGMDFVPIVKRSHQIWN